MRKFLVFGAALALLSSPVLAQGGSPTPQATPEQALEQAQSRLFAAQSDFYAAAARKLQGDLAAARKEAADTAAWWRGWWAGVFPAGKAK